MLSRDHAGCGILKEQWKGLPIVFGIRFKDKAGKPLDTSSYTKVEFFAKNKEDSRAFVVTAVDMTLGLYSAVIESSDDMELGVYNIQGRAWHGDVVTPSDMGSFLLREGAW